MQELQKYTARANDSRGLTLAAVKFVYNKATYEGVFEPTCAPALPRHMQPSSSTTREVHSISDSAQGSPNNTRPSPQDLARNPPDQDWEGSTTRTSRTLLEELAHTASRALPSRFGHRPPSQWRPDRVNTLAHVWHTQHPRRTFQGTIALTQEASIRSQWHRYWGAINHLRSLLKICRVVGREARWTRQQ